MYDIHCHILPQIDDGPSGVEKAVEAAIAAEQAGIKAIVCTPHYVVGKYSSSRDSNQKILEKLRGSLEQNGIGISLYLGNEVHVTPEIIQLLDSRSICTLNNSRYILLEMPVYNRPLFTDDIIFKLRLKGLIPVIAHPERYEWVSRSPQELRSIIEKGCLVQLNIASISGFYGSRTEKTAKRLLRENYIHFLASDSHASSRIYDNWNNNLRLLRRLSSEYEVKQMLDNNEALVHDKAVKAVATL